MQKFFRFNFCSLVAVCLSLGVLADESSGPDELQSVCAKWDSLPIGRRVSEKEIFLKDIESLGSWVPKELLRRAESSTSESPAGELTYISIANLKPEGCLTVLVQSVLAGIDPDSTYAGDALGVIGDSNCISALMTGLNSEANQRRVRAAEYALISISRNPKCVEPLLQACTEAFRGAMPNVKLSILRIVAVSDSSLADNVVQLALRDDSTAVVAADIGTLTRLRLKAMLPQLRGLLANTKDPLILNELANALGRVKDFESIPGLLLLLNHTDSGVRNSAIWAFSFMSGEQSSDPKVWITWCEMQTTVSKEYLDELFREIENNHGLNKAIAIEHAVPYLALREKLVPVLLNCLRDPDFCVRAEACNALGQTGALTSASQLLDSLSDTRPEVSFAAWRAMKQLTGQRLPRTYAAWREYFNSAR